MYNIGGRFFIRILYIRKWKSIIEQKNFPEKVSRLRRNNSNNQSVG